MANEGGGSAGAGGGSTTGTDGGGVTDDGASDGGAVDREAVDELGFDPDSLYRVVRAAVKDALLDVVGTLLLVGIGLLFVVAGGQALIAAESSVGAAGGAAFVLAGTYLAAASLGLIPSIGDLL